MGTENGPIPIQCSTPASQHSRLALKLFRGEPAIAEFDWNFSANHNSSPSVARLVGSVLPSHCLRGSTWPWLDHPASGLVQATKGTNINNSFILHLSLHHLYLNLFSKYIYIL